MELKEEPGRGRKHAPRRAGSSGSHGNWGGGVCQLGGGVPPSSGTVPEHWGSPRALCRGATSFRSGRKGLTALRPAPPPPPPGFHPRPTVPAGWGCAQRSPARPTPAAAHARTHAHTHARTQLAYFHSLPALAGTTASGSTQAATPVVPHVTHDARAPAAQGAGPRAAELGGF